MMSQTWWRHRACNTGVGYSTGGVKYGVPWLIQWGCRIQCEIKLCTPSSVISSLTQGHLGANLGHRRRYLQVFKTLWHPTSGSLCGSPSAPVNQRQAVQGRPIQYLSIHSRSDSVAYLEHVEISSGKIVTESMENGICEVVCQCTDFCYLKRYISAQT